MAPWRCRPAPSAPSSTREPEVLLHTLRLLAPQRRERWALATAARVERHGRDGRTRSRRPEDADSVMFLGDDGVLPRRVGLLRRGFPTACRYHLWLAPVRPPARAHGRAVAGRPPPGKRRGEFAQRHPVGDARGAAARAGRAVPRGRADGCFWRRRPGRCRPRRLPRGGEGAAGEPRELVPPSHGGRCRRTGGVTMRW